jgi:hypothetical protein
MAEAKFTTSPNDVRPNRVSSVDFLHAFERASHDTKPDAENSRCPISALEDAIEEERARLMLANSMLGCIQIALDPEAIGVFPAVYFPEVLEAARQSINESVRHLGRGEFRRLLYRAMGDGK